MKHTRSSAEWEIREAVVAHFREREPRGRIVHELNVDTGKNRADIAIIFPDTLVLIEIKSEKDKLARLERQFEAFQLRSHYTLIVAHEVHFEGDDLRDCPWMRWSHREHVWRYPAPKPWEFQRYRAVTEPHAALFLDLLWASELLAEMDRHGIGVRAGANRWEMVRDLTLKLTGKQIREAVCRQLRGRVMAEADPPILEVLA